MMNSIAFMQVTALIAFIWWAGSWASGSDGALRARIRKMNRTNHGLNRACSRSGKSPLSTEVIGALLRYPEHLGDLHESQKPWSSHRLFGSPQPQASVDRIVIR